LFPVDDVSWGDAVAFCAAISSRPEERALGHTYRLPTEAEWEYACRAGLASGLFHFGDKLGKGQANFEKKKAPNNPTPVGSYRPNAWGLSDMHGNVFEWCSDWFADYEPEPATDPVGPEKGMYRIFRGGCHHLPADQGRSASRGTSAPHAIRDDLGFRVARDHATALAALPTAPPDNPPVAPPRTRRRRQP
jgi:formylglycine-generating enzyme required for sulfatase activity